MSSHQLLEACNKQKQRRSSMGPGCTVAQDLSSPSLLEGCSQGRRTFRRRGSLKNVLSCSASVPILLVAGAASVSNLNCSNNTGSCLLQSADAFTASAGIQHPAPSYDQDKGCCSTASNPPDCSRRGMFGRSSRSHSMPHVTKYYSCATSLNLVADATVLSTVTADPGTISGMFSSSVITAGNAAASAASMIRPAPGMETFLMTKVAHILDMTSLINPESMLLKSMTFLERAMDMALNIDSNQQGDNVSLDDVIYQGGMLAASGKQVVSSVHKMMAGAKEGFLKRHMDPASSFRDRVAYHGLFSKAGMTLGEFNALLASGALTWIDMEPSTVDRNEGLPSPCNTGKSNDVTGNQSSIYWLYNGEASLISHYESTSKVPPAANKVMCRRRGKMVSKDLEKGSKTESFEVDHSINKKRNKQPFASELLADQNSLSTLMGLKDVAGAHISSDPFHLQVGKEGATLLKINVAKVRNVMEEDFEMDRKIRNLVYLSTRSKIEDMAVQ